MSPIHRFHNPTFLAPIDFRVSGSQRAYLTSSLKVYNFYVIFVFLQMNILLASSGGHGLKDHLPDITRSRVISGAILSQLKDVIKYSNIISHTSRPSHVYIIAGIPDITQKLKGPNYTECIYIGDPDKTIEHIKSNMKALADTTLEHGGTPIFCTITAINITKYNNFLKNTRKTSALKHAQHYPDMQTQIDTIIDSINNHIINTNINSNVSTPWLHKTITYRHGKVGRAYRKKQWRALYDGLHATNPTKKKWAESINKTISYNHNIYKSYTPQHRALPKRSWKYERYNY